MTPGEQARLQTIIAQRDAALAQWADANARAADAAVKSGEDKTIFEASIAKLKERIAELEAATKPDDHA